MIEKQNRVVGNESFFAHYLTRENGNSRKGVQAFLMGTFLMWVFYVVAFASRAFPTRAPIVPPAWWSAVVLGSAVVWASMLPLSPNATAQVDSASVQRAIDRGVTYLRKSQSPRGGWEEYTNQSCGASSMCTLALLNAGVSRDDPDVVRAMRYLRGIEPKLTYSVSLQTLVFCQFGAAGDLPRIRRNVERLVSEQNKQSAVRQLSGSWGYGGDIGQGDPSNTQFALLALGAAQDRGIEVESEVFQRSIEYWRSRQKDHGGWGYGRNGPSSGSMTCAGIASVIIAQGRLSNGSSQIADDQIRCCGDMTSDEDPVQKAIDWLASSFSVTVNPGGHLGTYYYYLYALERVGRLSGRRFIGDHDWYREGAEQLLKQQDNLQGFWTGGGWEEIRHIATSFAILFLSKGKRQVVIGQLQHGNNKNRSWQRHPDAMRQLVRHVQRQWGRDLTWQTIQADTASVADLLQTPVLIISDNAALEFSDETKMRLKQYVDQGGTIVFDADGGDGCPDATEFDSSVKKLCGQWFDGAQLSKLPPNHPVWFAERKVDLATLTDGSMGDDFWVYGLQACCRTSIFYVPRSLSCRWELSDALMRRNDDSPQANKQIDTAVRIGQNIIAYATGRELKDKLEKRILLDSGPSIQSDRGTTRLAMLGLDAGGDEAKRALPNAAAIIGQRAFLKLATSPQPVAFDTESLRDVFVLWIHGRTEFQFSAAQRKVLREFLASDGVILASAICGSEAFADSFRSEMKQILPDSPLVPMPPDHPAFTPAFDGDDVRRVTIRKPVRDAGGQNINRRQSHPMIEAAQIDSTTSVFFSPLDLSCALESSNSVQCPGYDTQTAAKIVGNLLLFSLQQ